MTTPALKYLDTEHNRLSEPKADGESYDGWAIRAVKAQAVGDALTAIYAKTYVGSLPALNALPEGTLVLGTDFLVVYSKQAEDDVIRIDSAGWNVTMTAERLAKNPLAVLWIPEA